MTKISFEQHLLTADANSNVLNTLLESNIDIPYGCRSGICQACLMQCTAGNINQAAQLGLTQQQKADGYFLSCCCFPQSDITIHRATIASRYESKVIDVKQLNPYVLQLKVVSPIPYQPGQSILVTIDGVQRRFSIASLPPEQSDIELHIECRPTGLFANKAKQLKSGDSLKLSSASGDCTYRSQSPEQPLLLVAHLTGLAPLIGVIRKALQHRHTGNIDLIHICGDNQFYYEEELRALALAHNNLSIHRLLLSDSVRSDFNTLLTSNWIQLQQHQLYFSGSHSLINDLAKQAFLQGAKQQQIHIEAFTCSK